MKVARNVRRLVVFAVATVFANLALAVNEGSNADLIFIETCERQSAQDTEFEAIRNDFVSQESGAGAEYAGFSGARDIRVGIE